MLFLSIVHHYLLWHYTRAFAEIFNVWTNLLWFTIHFFSIPQLLKSWFSPWKRMVEGRGKKWDLEDLAGFIIIGLISRILGFIMRSIVILIGLTALILMITGGVAVYVFWIAAPVFVILLLGFGISLLVA